MSNFISGLNAKKKRYVILALIIILLVGGYYWYNKNKTSSKTVQYKTSEVGKGNLTVSVSASGSVVVEQSATVDPTITGTVENLAVKVGEMVQKGQVLFTIKNDELDVSVAQSKASYLSAKKANSGSKKNKVTDANLKAAKLSYENAKTDADKRTVTAPISGTVNEINIKNGDDLSRNSSSSSSSDAPIIIGDLTTTKVEVDVNEVDVANVAVGQKVNVTLSAFDGETFPGQVEKIDSLGTTTSGVVYYTVTIDFDKLDARIKPGMSVSAEIITNNLENVILAPASAIKTQDGKNYVQVLENGAPQNINVEIGQSSETQTEIKSGLKGGEKVITQTITSSSSSSASSSSSSSSSSKSSSNRSGGPMMGF